MLWYLTEATETYAVAQVSWGATERSVELINLLKMKISDQSLLDNSLVRRELLVDDALSLDYVGLDDVKPFVDEALVSKDRLKCAVANDFPSGILMSLLFVGVPFIHAMLALENI